MFWCVAMDVKTSGEVPSTNRDMDFGYKTKLGRWVVVRGRYGNHETEFSQKVSVY